MLDHPAAKDVVDAGLPHFHRPLGSCKVEQLAKAVIPHATAAMATRCGSSLDLS
jgi:hypothetical protein